MSRVAAMVSARSKKLLLTALVAAFALQTVLVYSDELHGPIDEPALAGRALWHEYGCQVCHQVYGQGGFLGPDLTNAYSRIDSVRLHSLLTVGSGQMPALHLSAEQIASFRAYLRTLDRPELGRGQLRLGDPDSGGSPWARFARVAEPMMTSTALRGWNAVSSRPCAACHQPLSGSSVGAPDIALAAGRLTEGELQDVLANGRPALGMPPPVPPFSPDELSAVTAFLEWLNESRDSIASAMRATRPSRSIRWSDIPWWEYR